MSSKAVRILASTGGVALVVLAVAVMWVTATAGSGREPRFSGRTADEWLDRVGSADPAIRDEAAAMLSRAVVPSLMQTLRRPEAESGIHRTLVSLWNAVPGVFNKDLWTSVRIALREIAPDAATRAGIR